MVFSSNIALTTPVLAVNGVLVVRIIEACFSVNTPEDAVDGGFGGI